MLTLFATQLHNVPHGNIRFIHSLKSYEDTSRVLVSEWEYNNNNTSGYRESLYSLGDHPEIIIKEWRKRSLGGKGAFISLTSCEQNDTHWCWERRFRFHSKVWWDCSGFHLTPSWTHWNCQVLFSRRCTPPPRTQTEKAGGTGFSSTTWQFPPRESMQGLYRHVDTMCIKAWKESQLISPSTLFSVFLHVLPLGCHLGASCCSICSFCVDGTLQLVK